MADSGRWSWGAAACPGARDAGRDPANVFAVSVGAVRFRGAGSRSGARGPLCAAVCTAKEPLRGLWASVKC